MGTNSKIAVLVLAAGGSSRMGTPKQLLNLSGITLLDHVLKNISGGNYDIFIVTGAHRADIIGHIAFNEAIEIYNSQWQKGMGISISVGMKEAISKKDYSAIIICVADQVYLTRKCLHDIIELHVLQPQNIIASNYGMALGPPVLFPETYFTQLEKLSGDKGAKSIISEFPDKVFHYEFPQGATDLDTPEDYYQFINNNVTE